MNQITRKMENLCVRHACASDSELIASIISRAFKPVAAEFALDRTNCPTHPSLCTPEWIVSEIGNGYKYFIGTAPDGTDCGCVGYQKTGPKEIELRRLSVVPEYQNRGFGQQLVDVVERECRDQGIDTICISIIEEHTKLHHWYLKRGFVDTKTYVSPNLPFSVQVMEKSAA